MTNEETDLGVDGWATDWITGQPAVVVSDLPNIDVFEVGAVPNIYGADDLDGCRARLLVPDTDIRWPCTRGDHPGRHMSTGHGGRVHAAWPGTHLPCVEDLEEA